MRWINWVFLAVSHSTAFMLGLVVSVYILPVITAPDSPDENDMAQHISQVDFHGQFHYDLKGSDVLHRGQGRLLIGNGYLAFDGKLSPGSDYRMYFSPVFIETEEAFLQHKERMLYIGDINTFDRFLLALPDDIDWDNYTTAVVWSEAFGQFISAARFRDQ